MSHFAKVENGIVTEVCVVDQETINSGLFGDPSSWIKTSYNTRGGIHYGEDGQPDGGIALRGNYAKVGSVYDAERDMFYDNQGHRGSSWIFNDTTCQMEPPVPYPDDGKHYFWNPQTNAWSEIE
jgi:hypothetical protein